MERARIPESVLKAVENLGEYFRDGLLVRQEQVGSLHLFEMTLAPNFIIPRHHHNQDQLVIVMEGRARQGRRWFEPGDGYFTKAGVPYSTSAGPEGCKLLEIRKDDFSELETWWDESRPDHWARDRWSQGEA
ncbi:cupin domain-containing protein [Rhodococcus sp. WAY2]|uniref:cupin domain-containing protein n=1 Tax=Rhodococcus sp. WAY2 TaxID=2663121 RepID=UPI00131FA526|nr:hypothetical protein [Rhodococcus sp. WAY2]QHE73302.1 hypothetical protein GFS60_06957 [Rhodococcus sp. WAY2]